MNNYRVQDSCANCGYCVKGRSFDIKSASTREKFTCHYDKETEVETAFVCDNYTSKDQVYKVAYLLWKNCIIDYLKNSETFPMGGLGDNMEKE